ncbi:hypothetical protein Gpo141_00000661 [Globisporangium polare]
MDVFLIPSQEQLIGKRVLQAKNGNHETHIDEGGDYEPLRGKKLVAIDPITSDLLSCVDGDTQQRTTFRHTQDTRRKESKAKKKTTDFHRFKAYVEKKKELCRHLSTFYNEYIFRKLKLADDMRRQITEPRLLKQFEKLFGSGQEATVAIGDWDQRQHRKLKEPVKG